MKQGMVYKAKDGLLIITEVEGAIELTTMNFLQQVSASVVIEVDELKLLAIYLKEKG